MSDHDWERIRLEEQEAIAAARISAHRELQEAKRIYEEALSLLGASPAPTPTGKDKKGRPPKKEERPRKDAWGKSCYLKHKGWGTYSNNGAPYRRWTFEEPHRAYKAEIGDELHDRGPAFGEQRFQIRNPDSVEKGKLFLAAQEAADAFFLGVVPEWTPPPAEKPNRDIQEVAAALLMLSGSIQALLSAPRATAPQSATTKSEGAAEVPRDRGVYAQRGKGQWGRDVLLAVNTAGEVVRREDMADDTGPAEEAAKASHLTRYLDQVDPVEPTPEISSVVEAFLANPTAGPAPHEQDGARLLRARNFWRAGYELERRQRRTPRPCSECGEVYRPGGRNTKRCSDCLQSSGARGKKGKE